MFFKIYFFYATNPPLLFGLTCGFEPQISYPCVRLMQTKLLLVTSSHHHTILQAYFLLKTNRYHALK